jgi:hypothetical protein
VQQEQLDLTVQLAAKEPQALQALQELKEQLEHKVQLE